MSVPVPVPVPVPVRVVGAQITQPDDVRERASFAASLIGAGLFDGLEIVYGNALWREVDAAWLPGALPVGSTSTINLIGATMERTGSRFGLASEDAALRAETIRLVRSACDFVERLADRGVGTAAVLVHSAPTVDHTGLGAATRTLATSLEEIATWNWYGAEIIVEHCDARSGTAPYSKGYFPLAEELRVVQDLRRLQPPTDVGVAINWGRSAIEGRNGGTAALHIAEAAAAGLLRGIMLSGVSDIDGVYGPAWTDSHAPARPGAHGPIGESTSILNLDELDGVVGIPGLKFEGIKISLKCEGATAAERRAVNIAGLDTLRSASPWPDADEAG